jgi:hypothetical protein
MKYYTSIDTTTFNTPTDALRHIFNHYGTVVLREKFDEAFEIANSDKDIDEIHSPEFFDTFSVNLQVVDILKAVDIHLYERMFKDWIDRMYDEVEDAFEYDDAEYFTTIFGATIELA